MAEIVKVEIGGEKHAVIPPDFATTEELLVAYSGAAKVRGVTILRVYAAMIGLSTRLGKQAGADYVAEGCVVLAYGGKVYSHLRKRGVPIEQITAAAAVILPVLTESAFPTEPEVVAEVGKSEASADA